MDPGTMEKWKEISLSAMGEMGKKGLVEYEGNLFLPGFSKECLEYMRNWEMPENSVFVVSFPKTGTTWCNTIVKHILFSGNETHWQIASSAPMPLFSVGMAPREKYELYRRIPLPRLSFSTHLREELLNFEKIKKTYGKVIYVVRNPKDQAVSWYHFARKVPIDEETRRNLGKDWNEFYSNYLKGKHPCGLRRGETYPDHILGWLKHKDDEDFLLVVYENMKMDLPREIRRNANFLNVELTDDDVNSIAHKCSVESMKKAAGAEVSGILNLNVRKGEVGGWKEQLTVSQSELMDKLVEEKMSDSGIKFTYE